MSGLLRLCVQDFQGCVQEVPYEGEGKEDSHALTVFSVGSLTLDEYMYIYSYQASYWALI